VPRFAHSSYPVRPPAARAVDVNALESRTEELLLLDARAPARFRGEQEPIDPIAGRIPGAKNRFSNDNLGTQGIFKKPQLLRDEFRAVLGDRAPEEVVSYCGSGVAACHNLLAMELAGLRGGKLYAGSWSEWIADPARPREKG
jgi:thiosulfate/3-mercaptopyruvate sulfurtransferase